jgi:hypothetical protein
MRSRTTTFRDTLRYTDHQKHAATAALQRTSGLLVPGALVLLQLQPL